ncbi:CBL-interacting serine/threonine-protein kinase 23-like isoform X1 [Punica granatum]|uniref:CBL-interacting serine/threonine-protein kinase 23-like isoform X1 n=1 Tax=Punica granatum TaxID=22663 RepID=A0A6P8CDK2_PUNGR|nr:CBL-interacting serine/threonine-protein kinase 23-like isoform X1 [Punica granatum]
MPLNCWPPAPPQPKKKERLLSSLVRITIAEVIEHEWFKEGCEPPAKESCLDDGTKNAAFINSSSGYQAGDPENNLVDKQLRRKRGPASTAGPVSSVNAFDLLSTSQGLNLSSPFENQMTCIHKLVSLIVSFVEERSLWKRR